MSHSNHDHEPAGWLKTKVSAWFWSLTPTCLEVSRLTSQGLDRRLSIGMRFRLSLHRCFCKWCGRYARQLSFLREAAQRFPERDGEVGSATLGGDARKRIKRALVSGLREEQ